MRLCACFLALLLCGCGTVIPHHVDSVVTGDAVQVLPGGSTVISKARLDTYNALIDIYGASKDSLTGLPYFVKPIAHNEGVTPRGDGTYVLDREHSVKFGLMASWFRSGRKPAA